MAIRCWHYLDSGLLCGLQLWIKLCTRSTLLLSFVGCRLMLRIGDVILIRSPANLMQQAIIRRNWLFVILRAWQLWWVRTATTREALTSLGTRPDGSFATEDIHPMQSEHDRTMMYALIRADAMFASSLIHASFGIWKQAYRLMSFPFGTTPAGLVFLDEASFRMRRIVATRRATAYDYWESVFVFAAWNHLLRRHELQLDLRYCVRFAVVLWRRLTSELFAVQFADFSGWNLDGTLESHFQTPYSRFLALPYRNRGLLWRHFADWCSALGSDGDVGTSLASADLVDQMGDRLDELLDHTADIVDQVGDNLYDLSQDRTTLLDLP